MLREYGLLNASHDGNDTKPDDSAGIASAAVQQQMSPQSASAMGPIKIGCSKRTCRLCQQYILTLRPPDGGEPRIMLRSFSGKSPSGWRPPPDGPASAEAGMLAFLEDEINAIIRTAADWEGSDSEPSELSVSEAADSEVDDDSEVFTSIQA
jgi:hypothetical protein